MNLSPETLQKSLVMDGINQKDKEAMLNGLNNTTDYQTNEDHKNEK